MTDPATRVVFEEMNRDPGKFYPMETCALAVQFAEALIKAGVIPAPQKEVLDPMDIAQGPAAQE